MRRRPHPALIPPPSVSRPDGPARRRGLRRVAGAVLILAVAGLSGCGDDPPAAPMDVPPADGVYEPDPAGTLLLGPSTELAIDAVGEMLPSPGPPAAEPGGRLPTRLTGVLAAGATVGTVNEVMTSTDVRIVAMVPRGPIVSLVVPDAMDEATAEALAAELTATDAFSFVYPAREARCSGVAVDGLVARRRGDDVPAHLTLTHTPAAWNASALGLESTTGVTVIHPDHFGSDDPPEHVSAMTIYDAWGGLDDPGSPQAGLGVLHAGILGADPDAPGYRGVNPVPGKLNLVSFAVAGQSWVEVGYVIRGGANVEFFQTGGYPTVILTSLDYGDPDFEEVSLPRRAIDALAWRSVLAGWSPSVTFLQVTSAGDDGADTSVAFASPFTLEESEDDLLQVVLDNDPDGDPEGLAALQSVYATLAEDLTFALGSPVIVGASDATGDALPGTPSGTHVRMPGVDVPGPCPTPGGSCAGTGSGVATAQVAGLAAYLWTLAPTAQAVVGINITIDAAFSNGTTPGFVDAYAATLALDEDLLDPRVRKAILDVDENGTFEHVDLDALASAFATQLDEPRFDLNGDGDVGGEGTAWFDLDADRVYSLVSQTIAGEEQGYVEEILTDLDILCYYGWSDLYEGDPDLRNEILAACVPSEATIVLGRVDQEVGAGAEVGEVSDSHYSYTHDPGGFDAEHESAAVGPGGSASATIEYHSTIETDLSGNLVGITATATASTAFSTSASRRDDSGSPAALSSAGGDLHIDFRVIEGPVAYTLTVSLDGTLPDVESGEGIEIVARVELDGDPGTILDARIEAPADDLPATLSFEGQLPASSVPRDYQVVGAFDVRTNAGGGLTSGSASGTWSFAFSLTP